MGFDMVDEDRAMLIKHLATINRIARAGERKHRDQDGYGAIVGLSAKALRVVGLTVFDHLDKLEALLQEPVRSVGDVRKALDRIRDTLALELEEVAEDASGD